MPAPEKVTEMPTKIPGIDPSQHFFASSKNITPKLIKPVAIIPQIAIMIGIFGVMDWNKLPKYTIAQPAKNPITLPIIACARSIFVLLKKTVQLMKATHIKLAVGEKIGAISLSAAQRSAATMATTIAFLSVDI
jgi:hypothetical protein